MEKIILTFLSSSLAVSVMAQTSYNWQHADVKLAWRLGFKGQDAVVHVHDQFDGDLININLKGSKRGKDYVKMTHGDIVSDLVRRTAPLSSIERRQWDDGNISLQTGRLNVVNASYGRGGSINEADVAYAQTLQLVTLAHSGQAVVVKAAGNSAKPLSNQGGGDAINMALKTADAVIFVGALQDHGSTVKTVRLGPWSVSVGGASNASYTNTPGRDADYQQRFLMVGVPNNMSVQGTSFAAPQISAYAAIVGSKFLQATPMQITNQLLSTARKDTISGYNLAIHGQGEASLSRALAPSAIN
jgi:hypothetical protein